MRNPDRRGGARIARPILVKYRRPGEVTWQQSPVRDLSRSGARLLSETPLEAGMTLEFWIGLPLFVEPVQLIGKVMWQKGTLSGTMGLVQLGITFEGLDAATQKILDDAIERFVRQQGGK